jgi:hypothetical protein
MLASKETLTFAPVVDTSTITGWDINSNNASGAYPMEAFTDGNGNEINRISLSKYSDNQVNGEGYDYSTPTEPLVTSFRNNFSSPLVFLENDAQSGVALVFKRLTPLLVKIGTADAVAPERIITPESGSGTQSVLNSNDDMTDGQVLYITTGSVYVRNSDQSGDSTTSYYAGWDDPAFTGSAVEITGRYPDKFSYSIGTFTDSGTKSSVELINYGERLHLQIDYSNEVTIKQIVQGVVDSYNAQDGEKIWDFSLVTVTDTGYVSV